MTAERSRKATRRAERRRRLFRSLAGTAAAVFAVTVIALGGVGGTYALWAKAAPAVTTTTLSAGTASMTVSQPDAFTLLAPGRTASHTFVIDNTGDADLNAAITASSFSGPLASVATITITDSSTCTGGNVVWTRTPTTKSSDGTVVAMVPEKTNKTLCMNISIDAAAALSTEGTSMTSSFSFVGSQP